MIQTITIQKQDWQTIPKQAQQEVYDFFQFVKQKYQSKDEMETINFSNHSANLIKDWQDDKEDEIWQ